MTADAGGAAVKEPGGMPPSSGEPEPPVMESRRVWLTWLGVWLAVAAWMGVSETGRLIGQVAVADENFNPNAVYGLTVLTRPFSWTQALPAIDVWRAAWLSRGGSFTIVGGLEANLLFDFLFVAGYTVALWAALPRLRARAQIKWLVLAVAGVDVLENVVAATTLPGLVEKLPGSGPDWRLGVLHAVTAAKWLLVIALALTLVAVAVWHRPVRVGARRLGVGLKFHRYQLVIVGVLLALMITTSGEIGDQLPDVMRAWLDGATGLWHAVVAALALAVVVIELVVIGRSRAGRYGHLVKMTTEDRPEPRYGGWTVFWCAAYALGAAALATARGWSWPPMVLLAAAPAVVAAGVARAGQTLLPGAGRINRHQSVAVVGGGCFVLALLGYADKITVSWPRFWATVLIPAALIALSAWLARRSPDASWMTVRSTPKRTQPGNRVVERTGDGVAVVVVSLVGAGLVRSYTAPAAVLHQPRAYIGLAIGFAIVLAAWAALYRGLRAWSNGQDGDAARLRRLHEALRKGEFSDVSTRWRRAGTAVLALNAALVLWLLLDPLRAASWLGVLGIALIALGALTSLLGLAALASQRTKPWPVFRLVRLRATPLLSLAALIAVVAAVLGTPDVHHDVRSADPNPAAIAPAARPDLPAAFSRWISQRAEAPATCGTTVTVDGRDLRVTPMVLVAAAGGGIRAAYWTVGGMSALLDHPVNTGCTRAAVFASSGVSGGSVGLTLIANTGSGEAAHRAVAALSTPDALSAAASGLLLTDVLSGISGLNVPPLGWPAGQPADRAAFMERTWISEATEDRGVPPVAVLNEPFLTADPGRAGQLLLNSTSVTTKCRAVVSTMRVAPDVAVDTKLSTSAQQKTDAPAPSCNRIAPAATATAAATDATAKYLLPDSYDVLDAYTNPAAGSQDAPELADCRVGLSASTAAMLSARFPYVTPTGVMPACNGLRGDQFVDGGYAEPTGLGTVADLAPALMALVRQHNADVLAGSAAAPGKDLLLVPFVVFLENHYRLDLARRPPVGQPEVLAPLRTKAANSQMGDTTRLLQRITAQYADWVPCPSDDSACVGAVQQIGRSRPARIVVLAPASAPRVEAPLGWVLSRDSQSSMDEALASAAKPCRDAQPSCPSGYAHIDDLREALGIDG